MSSVTQQGKFLALVERFLSRELAAAAFCAQFTSLWVQDRAKTYAKKAVWSQPYDEMLLASWQRGEITDSEFQRESAKLWGYAEEMEFRTMINEIHSACSAFSPAPEREWEIDEEQLRRDVQAALEAYERVIRPVAQAA